MFIYHFHTNLVKKTSNNKISSDELCTEHLTYQRRTTKASTEEDLFQAVL